MGTGSVLRPGGLSSHDTICSGRKGSGFFLSDNCYVKDHLGHSADPFPSGRGGLGIEL